MAADSGTLTFTHANKTAFYFTDVNKDVDEDSFLTKRVDLSWIKSGDNKLLILNDDNEFQAQDLPIEEQEHHPEHKFNINQYKNSDPSGKIGVILYACRDSTKVVVCCKNELEVQPVEMDVPSYIPGKAHQAIFYWTQAWTSTSYLLESSQFPSRYLAFEPDKDNHKLSRLVLRHKEKDEVDECCQIRMS